MVICKYFLQGTCRFGENCKFEHQINTDHSYGGTTSVLLHNYSNKPAQSTSNVDTNTLIKAVVNDMVTAEKGGQWLLSSYAPFREKPAFPGFEDHTMEEIRYLFYEAVKNGTLEQYKQNLQMMLQQSILKIKALQNPSTDAINMLKNIYNTPPSSSLNQSNSVFGGTQTQQKSVFGAPNTNQNLFRSANTGQGVFSGGTTPNPIFGGGQAPNPIFGQQNQKSVFGGTQQPSNNSMFGSPSFTGGTSIFGQNNQTHTSSFGQNSNPSFGQTSQSPFGNAPPQQNMFQQSPNQFGAPPNVSAVPVNTFAAPPLTNSPFGAPPNASAAPVNAISQFGAPPNAVAPPVNSNSPFNAGAPAVNPSSPFGTPQTGNFTNQPVSQFGTMQAGTAQFATPQNTQFGPQQTNKPSFQHTQSIFGNLVLQQPGNSFGNVAQSKPNEEFYSKLEDLTEDEIKWFQSDDLDVMKIPEKPPAYEMCFKVQ